MLKRFFATCLLGLMISFSAYVSIGFFSSVVWAQGSEVDVELLAPLPKGEGTETTDIIESGDYSEGTTYLFEYIEAIYAWVFVLAGVLAVLMIVVGGYEVMMSGTITTVEAGKQRIINAVSGILLLLLSGLLLYTINPQAFDALRPTGEGGGGDGPAATEGSPAATEGSPAASEN